MARCGGRSLAALSALMLLGGCGSSTVTVDKTAPPAPPTTVTQPTATSTPKASARQFNNPAQQPDPNVKARCNEVPLGHACLASTAAPEDPNVSPQRNCDTNIVANARTSCALAENAFYEYYQAHVSSSNKLVSIMVHSPTTGKDYELGCQSEKGLIGCESTPTSDYIFVTFPEQAINVYNDEQARAYAASRDVGHPQKPYTPPTNERPESGSGEDKVGSYSHEGDTKFCAEHECIGEFESEPGYVVECRDSTYSHSGGISGACSSHGGIGRRE